MLDDFFENVLSPLRFIRRVGEDRRVRFGLWTLYVGIAVSGTMLFGFSFGLVYGGEVTPWGWGFMITVAAGAGWMFFMPTMVALLGWKKGWVGGVHACLVTMAFGEAVLEVGTILNLIGYWRGTLTAEHALVANVALVGVSNVVMLLVMALQMRELGERVWKTALLWIVLLNGVGAGVFWVAFGKLIFG